MSWLVPKESWMIIDKFGLKTWRNKKGQLHRKTGPATIHAGEYDSDGCKEWYLNGKLHREDGPAVEWDDGTKCWYKNGKLHREDGPAVEDGNGTKVWRLNGVDYTEEEWKTAVDKLKNS